MSGPIRVSEDPPFAEGPVWCSAAGESRASVVCTSVSEGALFRVDVATGSCERLVETGGGPNGAAPCADGGFLVTQNGGLDFEAVGMFEDPPPYRPTRSGLQRAFPDGSVGYLTPDRMQAPNDLVVAPDGTVFFTDPPPYPLPEDARGRLWAYGRDGTLDLVADGLWYPNGIGIEPDGSLVIVENGLMGRPHFGLVRVHGDGTLDRFVDQTGDGLCLDADGRLYVAGGIHGVTVLEPDGTVVEVLRLPEHGVTTNCCFGGYDGRTLYATDAVPGGVWAWEAMPTPGLALTPWPGPA
ncbi:MAG: SMP-30/gluconolactonase/LRE family protein [Acidimicrobiia bacterium]